MYLRAAKTEAQEAGEETEGMANSISKLRSEIKTLTKGQVDIMANDSTYKSTYQILQEMSKIWDQLADVDQARLLELMGGKRNANVLSSILTNFDVAEKSLETSLGSAGSAMRENDKYLDSIQGRLDQLSAAFEKLSTKLLSSTVVKGFVTILRGLVVVLGDLLGILGGFPGTALMVAAGVTAIVFALKKLTDTASIFNSSDWFKGGKLAKIITAISLIVAAISAVVGVLSGAQEKVKELNKSIDESRSKQAEITAELEKNEEIRTRILKLQAEGRATAADDAELKRIERENAALRVKLSLQQELEKQKVRGVVEENSSRLTKDWTDGLFVDPFYSAGDQPEFGARMLSDIAMRMGVNPANFTHPDRWNAQFSDQDLLDAASIAIRQYGMSVEDHSGFAENIAETMGIVGWFASPSGWGYTWAELLRTRYEEIEEATRNIMGLWSDNPTTDYDKEINRQIQYFEDFQIQYMSLQGYEKTAYDLLKTSNAYSKYFTEDGKILFDSLAEGTEDYKAALQMLTVAQNSGLIPAEYALDTADDLRVAYAYLSKEVAENADRWQHLGYEVAKFEKIANDFQSAADAISAAQEDMAKNGRLSLKSIIALEKSGLADYIVETANGYILADNALEKYLEAQRVGYSDAVSGAIKNANDLITKQLGVAAAYDGTTESVLNQLKALRAQHLAALGNVQSEAWAIRYGYSDPYMDQIDKAIRDIENTTASQRRFEKLWEQYQADLLGGTKTSSSSSSKTPAERAADAWKTRLNEQKHLLQMGIITEKEYYKWLSDNYRKDLGDYADNLDERKSLDEDYYNWLKNQYKKDLDDQKKALQDRQNELKEFYDNQKKMVEDAYDKEEEENKRAEYAKEIARLDTLIARLSLDTTQEAKRRLAEAQDDLAKQRKEYEDWEKGNAKDAILDALDEQYEAENKEIEEQVNSIDSTVENLDSTTSAIYDVISQWAQDKGYAVPQYARGTPSSFGGGAITQERASELIGMNVGSGRFTMLSPNSKVWSGAATDILYRFANAPGSFIASLMARMGGTRGGQNMVAMGDIVINGNADSGTVAALRRERSALVYQVLSELKKLK